MDVQAECCSGGKTPYDVVNSQFGRDEVKDIIGRIDYGAYSLKSNA